MKLFAPLLFAAVSAFPSSNVDGHSSNVDGPRRALLSTTPQLERGWNGVNPWNSDVDRATLISAAKAADAVYNINDCQDGAVKHGDFTCMKAEEVTYKFWFDDNAAKIRFHFFKAPNNKCGFVFRGTENGQPAEWWTNLNFAVKEPAWWFMGEYVHKGYKDAFDGWWETYYEENELGLPVSKKRWRGGEVKGKFTWYLNHYKADCLNGVYFVGHSLGGALATVADIWYAQTYGIDKKAEGYQPEAVSITFGAPMLIAQKTNKRRANELRIIHENDPVSSDGYGFMNYDAWGKNLEHRGPAKVIKCKSDESSDQTCSKIIFENGNDQKWSGVGSSNYHSMYNYMKYVQALDEPLKLKDTSCTKDAQCHTGYCSCSRGSCKDPNGLWAWTTDMVCRSNCNTDLSKSCP